MDSPAFLFSTRATQQQIRLIDNLDSGHMDNISDIPQLSTNEKAGVRGVVAENGRIVVISYLKHIPYTPLFTKLIEAKNTTLELY